MAWVEVFVVFLVCHQVGDYLLQTDWQATNKRGGLGADPVARRALASHVFSYTLAFTPAFVWLAGEIGTELVPVIVAAPADARTRAAWLERLFDAHSADQIPYIERRAIPRR